jgi:aerotaxis receptor
MYTNGVGFKFKTASGYKMEFTYSNNGEVFFPQDFLIISETDEKGVITYANSNFCKIACYSIDELIGQPHNIVRHPDMPRAAFKLVWDSIQTKGYWAGFVKNMRKDGKFYWVYSTILKKISSNGNISYISIRTAPKKQDVQKAEALYNTLK